MSVVGQHRPGGSKTSFHLSQSHAAGETKGNAHILVQQEAMLFPHGHGFGNAFNLSTIFTCKKAIKKALIYSPYTDIKHTISQHT